MSSPSVDSWECWCGRSFNKVRAFNIHIESCDAVKVKKPQPTPSREVIESVKFKSSSSDKIYETLVYSDGLISCNCPGWTKRVAKDGSRSCKHTKKVKAKIKVQEMWENGKRGKAQSNPRRCSDCEGNGMIFEPRSANQWIRCPLCLGESSGITKAELLARIYKANMEQEGLDSGDWGNLEPSVTKALKGKPKSPPTSVTPAKRKFEFD